MFGWSELVRFFIRFHCLTLFAVVCHCLVIRYVAALLTRCFLHAFFGMVLNAQLDQVYSVHLRWGKSHILLNKHQRYLSAFRLVCILSVFHIDFHLTQYSLFQRRVFPESFFILTAELTITEARAKMFFQTQTARRPLKLTLTFKFIRARHLPCEFCTDPFSGSRDISYITKNSHKQCRKQSLTQFTVCGKDKDNPNSITLALFLRRVQKHNT